MCERKGKKSIIKCAVALSEKLCTQVKQFVFLPLYVQVIAFT
jgi:hypothetical protein